MSPKKVHYFFSFPSPFAALADSRIDDLVAEAGGELVPVPVVAPQGGSPPTGLAAQLQEWKIDYIFEDAARWAKRLGLPWSFLQQRGLEGTDASAGWYFAQEHGRERAYRSGVFRASFGEGRNIDDHEVLSDCAEGAGLSRADFLEALQAKRYHDEVPKALQLCMQNKVFGVPFFVVDGARFWGNDRIDFLSEEIRRP